MLTQECSYKTKHFLMSSMLVISMSQKFISISKWRNRNILKSNFSIQKPLKWIQKIQGLIISCMNLFFIRRIPRQYFYSYTRCLNLNQKKNQKISVSKWISRRIAFDKYYSYILERSVEIDFYELSIL